MVNGSCHCGAVRFECDGVPTEGYECNCSHCSRKGFVLWFVPRQALRVTAGEGALTTYLFNRHVIAHQFCPTCGCQPLGLGKQPDGTETAAINLRCLEGFDLETVKRIAVDGRAF